MTPTCRPDRASSRPQYWLRILLFALLSVFADVRAEPVQVPAADLPLDLLPLMSGLRRDFTDPGDAGRVMAAEDWQPAADCRLGSVFQPVTLWLRVPLVNRSDSPVSRTVAIRPWRISDIRVSLWNAETGREEQVAVLGWSNPDWRPADGLEPLVEIRLEPGEERVLLVRLRDRTFGTPSLSLLTDAQAERLRLHRFLIQAMVLSGVLVLVVLLLLQRRWTYTFAAGYFATGVVFELCFDNWLLFWLFPDLLPYLVPVMLGSAASSGVLFAVWSLSSFPGERDRGWIRLGVGWSVLLLAVVVWSMLTDEHHLPRLALALLGVVGFLLWPLLFFWLRKPRIDGFRRSIMFLFVVLWGVQLARAVAAAGLVPSPPFGWAIPLLAACLAVLVILALGGVLQQRERQRLDSLLARARERELAGNLSAGIVHDINNLLAILALDVELLKSGFDREDPAVRKQLLDEVGHVAAQAATVTRGILLLGGSGSLPCATIDVTALVEESVAMLVDALPAEVSLHLHLPPHPVTVTSNATTLQLSLLNLIFNARDAMLTGGRIVVSLSDAADGDGQPMDIGRAPEGPHVCLSVCDEGPGIDPGIRERVFEPLASTKPTGRGHGLGLFMVGQFVERTNIGLRIDSRPGAGTCVRLLFPRVPVDPPAPGPLLPVA